MGVDAAVSTSEIVETQQDQVKMIKSLFAAVSVLGMVAPAAASAQVFGTPELTNLFVTADENYAKLDFTPTAWSKQWKDLGTGDRKTFEIRLDADDAMSFLAICGEGCTNLDMRVTDPDGNEMGSDTKDDRYPIVGFRAPREGTYVVEIIMVACAAASCPFGIKAYEKQ